MADLTITAANIIPVAGYLFKDALSAAALTQGQSVYLDSNNKWALADADASATATGTVGITLSEATAANQPVRAIVSGDLGFGAILTDGQIYVVSTTAGGIAPYSDLGAGDFVTILGVASSTSNLKVHIFASGADK